MPEPVQAPTLSAEELVARLEAYAAEHARLAEVPYPLRKRLLAACGKIADPRASERRAMRRALRRRDNRAQRERDLAALMQAALRRARRGGKAETALLPKHALPAREPFAEALPAEPWPAPAGSSQAPAEATPAAPAELGQARYCYVCKAPYTRVHFFYDSMCADCAERNHAKRTELCDLRGRVALVTGGRIKIGHEI